MAVVSARIKSSEARIRPLRVRAFLHFVLLILLLASSTTFSATAQPPMVNDFNVILFGRIWRVVSYFVQDDLLVSPLDDTFLEPEGVAFKDGLLYVSGDREPEETSGRLAIYNYPVGGPLSFDDLLQMPDNDPEWWGPEGLTFNTFGSGYGSGANYLVSVEYDDPNQLGVVNLATGDITDRRNIERAEDIAFLPAAAQFAILADKGSSIDLTFFDIWMNPTGSYFTVAPASNGLASVGASFGSSFTRTTQNGEIFIVVTKANPGNGVLAYDLAGNQIGRQFNLPTEPKAQIPIGGGFYLIKPAFGVVEAIAIDQAGKTIFIGDETNSMVHVLTFVRLAADLDSDADVDLYDFDTLADKWLLTGCTYPDWCDGADIDRSTDVDFWDFSPFGEQWRVSEIY